MKSELRHLRFLISYWPAILTILICGILVSLMEGIGISLIFPVLQGVQGLQDFNMPAPFDRMFTFFENMSLFARLRWVVVFLVLVTAFKEVTLFIKNILVAKISLIVSRHFQMECIQQAMRAGMGYFNKQKAGDLHSILYAHASNIGISISRFGTIIELPFIIIVLLVMLLLLSWKVTIVSFCLALLLIFVMRGLVKRSEVANRNLGAVIKHADSTLFEIISGMKIIRQFSREDSGIKRYDSALLQYNNTIFNIRKIEALVSPITQFSGMVCVAIIIFSSLAFLPRSGVFSLLFVFLVAFTRIMGPVMNINKARVNFIGDLPYYREVFNFLDIRDKQFIDNGKIAVTNLNESIKFDNVDFAYNADNGDVLSGLSFNIAKGTKVGIVGPSGSGKSTITELLFRFYDPQRGKILVDGVDLRDLELSSWRKIIGIVAQDIFLFNDTIRANIAFAKPDVSLEEIKAAAIKAYAHEFIVNLPNGYDTIIGDRGVLLSVGQRQRIAIARAIIINPQILVFDEATSALDTESERIVQRALDEAGKGRTVITIAHRLSTIFDSDNIVVIDAGRIAEQGSHSELMLKQGLYNKLVKMQEAKKQVEEEEHKFETEVSFKNKL